MSTDMSMGFPLYLHVPHRKTGGMGGTVFRVHPVGIRGYRCNRLEMTAKGLCWLYDRV